MGIPTSVLSHARAHRFHRCPSARTPHAPLPTPISDPLPAARPFGAHITVEDVAAKQVRIERQDAATAASLSIDRQAANVFQSYVQGGSLLQPAACTVWAG